MRRTLSLVIVLVGLAWAPLDAQRRATPETPAGASGLPNLSGIWHRKGPLNGKPNQPPVPTNRAAGFEKAFDDAYNPTYDCSATPIPGLINDDYDFQIMQLPDQPVEFVQTPGRLLQLFQWERTLRELWMDGRPVPTGENLDNLGPAWYGHTAGGWEGNTLVMQTVGLDDRAWIDIFGFPKSAAARIEERYTRTGPDTIELRMTLHDPTFYKAPWVSDVKTFTRVAPRETTFFGWYGLFSGLTEGICAPMNEVDSYNTLFRDRTSRGVVK